MEGRSVGRMVRNPFFFSFLCENNRGSPLLIVLGVLGVLNVLSVLHVLHVLHVFNMPMACWALFILLL